MSTTPNTLTALLVAKPATPAAPSPSPSLKVYDFDFAGRLHDPDRFSSYRLIIAFLSKARNTKWTTPLQRKSVVFISKCIPPWMWLTNVRSTVPSAAHTSALRPVLRTISKCILYYELRTAWSAMTSTTVVNSPKGRTAPSCTVAGVARAVRCIAAQPVRLCSANRALSRICLVALSPISNRTRTGTVSSAHRKYCGPCGPSTGLLLTTYRHRKSKYQFPFPVNVY